VCITYKHWEDYMTNPEAPVSARLDGTAAAAYLGRSRSWLDKARASGHGPRFLKIGSRVLYRVSDLDAYINGCARETTDSRKAAA